LSNPCKDEKTDDTGKNELRKVLAKLQLELEQKADEDNLCTAVEKNNQKGRKKVLTELR